MASFDRGLSREGLHKLVELIRCDKSNWWCDLLAAWTPSGHPGGLRLAVRNGYLNFYKHGQSVARVGFGRGGIPQLHTHQKYVLQPAGQGQKYLKFTPHEGCDENGARCSWGGQDMLSRWIDQTANFQGIEKAHVEQAVAAMPGVVDLEMGLPASGAQTTALRMDLVALERISSRLNIVFWEAKMIGDGRLRSRTTPEVFSQIEAYVRFLENREHRLQVIEAYRRACKLLINFNEVAQCAFGTPSLDPIVYEAAADGSPLDVDVTPRLMIFDDGMPRNEQAWQCHLDKVKERTTVEFIPVGGFQTVAAI